MSKTATDLPAPMRRVVSRHMLALEVHARLECGHLKNERVAYNGPSALGIAPGEALTCFDCGLVDAGLLPSAAQLAAFVRVPAQPTRPVMLTFERATAAYRELLEQHPGKALRIDSDNIAFLLDGALVGCYDGNGVPADEFIYDFDRSAWDDGSGCWAGAGEQTQAAINDPVFTEIPTFS